MTVRLGVFLFTDRNWSDGEWVDGTNRVHIAGPHDVHAGYPTDLFECREDAPEYNPLVSRVAELIAESHPVGAIDSHEETEQGTFRKLGEVVVTLDGEIVESEFNPCPECLHHIDSTTEEPDTDDTHHNVTYECVVDGDTVYHVGFGRNQ